MRSLIFPTDLTAVGYPAQLFYSESCPLLLQQTTSTNVNIGTLNGTTPIAVKTADDIDAAAFIQQINNAINSSSMSSFCAGYPVAPVGLAPTAGVNSVALAWTAYTGATSYNIYRGTATGAETLLASSATNAYTDSVIATGGAFYYKVTAIFNGVETRLSSEVNATPTATALTSISPDPFNAITDSPLTVTGSGFVLAAGDYTMVIQEFASDHFEDSYSYTCAVSDANTIVATYSATAYTGGNTNVRIGLFKGGILVAAYLTGTVDDSGNITI